MDSILAAREAAPPASDRPRDLFDVLLAVRDPETGAALPRAELRDHVATLLIAGHETLALTLFWALLLLALVPEEQDRVAAEVAGADLGAAAHATVGRLVRTRAVLDETLRLYPPAFLLVREAIAEDRAGDTDRGREGCCPPRPPNRAGGSPAHGSPVAGFLIGSVARADRLCEG